MLDTTGGNGIYMGTFDSTNTYASYIQSAYLSDSPDVKYNLILQPDGGNVGIGTSTLTAAAGLAIKKNGDNLYLEQSNADNGWIIQTLDADGYLHFERRGEGGSPSNTERVVFTTTGSVGIGNSAPDQKLTVGGHILQTSATDADSANKYAIHLMEHYDTDDEEWPMISGWSQAASHTLALGGYDNGFNAATEIKFYTAANVTTRTGTERMTIKSDGHIGIAATPETDWNSSFQAIHLGNQTAFANFTNRGGYWLNNLRFNGSSQFTYIRTDEAAVVDFVDGHFRVRMSASGSADANASPQAKFYVSNGGQTVINSSTPKGNAKLSIYGGMWVDPQTWQMAGSGNDSTTLVAMAIDDYGGIYSWFDGYNRNIIRSRATGIIDIGQTGTGIWNTINLMPGDSGKVQIYGDDPSSSSAMLIATFEDANLTLAGQIKIAGGSPGADKVLTSNAAGLATWEDASGGGGYALSYCATLLGLH